MTQPLSGPFKKEKTAINNGAIRPEYEELMTAQEVADYLKISRPSVYKKAQHEGLPHLRLGVTARDMRFRMSAIQSWLNEKERRS